MTEDNSPIDFTVIDSVRKTASGNKKIYWIPYLQRVEKVFKTKTIWEVYYNGGSVLIDMTQTDSIMLYGIADGEVSLEFLNDAIAANVLMLIHKRNSAKTGVFTIANGVDVSDVLTFQIQARTNSRKRVHIAKQLIKGQIIGRARIVGVYTSNTFMANLQKANSVDTVRNFEAQITRKYWKIYFTKMGFQANRRDGGIVQQALNAGSMFMVGILLRWCIYHKLSPHHGYLHVTTRYISLVYDLIEPFRYLIEKAVLTAYLKHKTNNLIGNTIFELKMLLDETVYTNTRQHAKIKTMLHGQVLSLCAYLKGTQDTFVIVKECTKSQAMKKPKFRLPGPPKNIDN